MWAKESAIKQAIQRAKKTGTEKYVVFDPSSEGGPWCVCTEEDLDGFYLGCEPVAVADSYGNVD